MRRACRSLTVLVAPLWFVAAAAAGADESAPAEPSPARTTAAAPAMALPEVPALVVSMTDPLPAATIAYEVYREGVGFAVGRSEHRIERTANGGYRIATVWETSGLAAVLKRVRVHHVSEGEIIGGRLRPTRYRTWRDDKNKEASAVFDWPARQVTQALGVEPLPAGTLDPVTIFYQYRNAGGGEPPTELRVANGRRIKRLSMTQPGREDLTLPGGESVTTRRLKAIEDDGETTELWLAERYAGYPLQITHTDRDGTRYRQIATSIRLEPHALAQPPR